MARGARGPADAPGGARPRAGDHRGRRALIDSFAGAGHADLVDDLAEPFPAIVIGRMVGLDQAEAVHARDVAAALFASIGTESFPDRMGEFADWTRQHLDHRRSRPREDFLTQMASGEIEGMEVDENVATGLMVALIVGGHHSTGSAITGLIRHLLTEPGLKDAILEDRKVLARVMEESLRLTTPLQLFGRTTTCPAAVGDEQIPAGRRVLLNLASANRDPREFSEPETFDPRRSRNRHVAFGAGSHVCIGQHLARAELRIAVDRLLDRLPDLHIDGEAVEIGLVGGNLITHSRLPVSFTPETR